MEFKHRVEQKESFQIIGRKKYMTYANEFWHDIVKMWEEWDANGELEKLEKYSKDSKGVCINLSFRSPSNDDPERFAYVIGVKYNGIAHTEDYDIIPTPAGRYVVFDVPEKYRDDVGEFMGATIEKHMPALGFTHGDVEVEYFNGDTVEAWLLIKE